MFNSSAEKANSIRNRL